MTAVMIGIDPHKGSHTAVAIDTGEVPLGRVPIRASPDQAGQLLAWARAWPDRTWAAGGTTGLGHLLAQQLVAAGERGAGHPAQAGRVQRQTPDGPHHNCQGSSRRGTIRRTPRHQEAPHEGGARPARLAGLVWAKPRTLSTPATSPA
jgi:transposase